MARSPIDRALQKLVLLDPRTANDQDEWQRRRQIKNEARRRIRTVVELHQVARQQKDQAPKLSAFRTSLQKQAQRAADLSRSMRTTAPWLEATLPLFGKKENALARIATYEIRRVAADLEAFAGFAAEYEQRYEELGNTRNLFASLKGNMDRHLVRDALNIFVDCCPDKRPTAAEAGPFMEFVYVMFEAVTGDAAETPLSVAKFAQAAIRDWKRNQEIAREFIPPILKESATPK